MNKLNYEIAEKIRERAEYYKEHPEKTFVEPVYRKTVVLGYFSGYYTKSYWRKKGVAKSLADEFGLPLHCIKDVLRLKSYTIKK